MPAGGRACYATPLRHAAVSLQREQIRSPAHSLGKDLLHIRQTRDLGSLASGWPTDRQFTVGRPIDGRPGGRAVGTFAMTACFLEITLSFAEAHPMPR